MQIVSSTFIALILCALMAMRGPYRGLVIFFGLMPMGAMAAFNLPSVGGSTITASDLSILVLFCSLALRPQGLADLAGSLRVGQPGFLLLLTLGYATVATLFFPRVFEGQTQVFGIGRVANEIGIVIRPLRPDGGNLSQLFRMVLSALAFVTMATVFRRNPDVSAIRNGMIAATLVHVGLGVIDVATYSTGTTWIMQVFRTANYTLTINHEVSGVKRMIGGFPEASAFGYFTLGIFGFWLQYWLSSPMRRAMGIYLLLSAAVLLRSTSSSAYVAGAGLLLVMLVRGVLAGGNITVSRRVGWAIGVSVALVPLLAFSVVWAYETMPGVQAFLDRALLNKLESDSGVERMSWNAQAFQNFRDTLMLGAGLGSVRASNWIIASLATLGVIGTALMVGWVWAVLRVRAGRAATPERAVMILSLQAGCLGLLVRALVVKASPNLDVLFFAMAGAAVGLSRATVTVSATKLTELPVFQTIRPHRAI